MAEEPCNEKEQLHSEGVTDKHEVCDNRAGRYIHDCPADEEGHKGHAGVKDDTEKQGEGAYRIEIVKSIIYGWGRHGSQRVGFKDAMGICLVEADFVEFKIEGFLLNTEGDQTETRDGLGV